MKLGQKIREQRLLQKISQAKLAKMIGCKRANIANIEAGRIYPSVEKMIKLSSMFGINFIELAEKRLTPPTITEHKLVELGSVQAAVTAAGEAAGAE